MWNVRGVLGVRRVWGEISGMGLSQTVWMVRAHRALGGLLLSPAIAQRRNRPREANTVGP